MQVKCSQCGAEFKVKPNEKFFSCGYCGSSLYLDISKIIFHYYLSPKIEESDLKLILSSFLQRGNLKRTIEIKKKEIFYFPFWLLRKKEGEMVLKLASSTAIDEIENVIIPPAGKFNFFNPESTDLKYKKIVTPTIAYDTVKKTIEKEISINDFSQVMLLHLPFFLCQYRYGREKGYFTALVDAAGGKVFTNSVPQVSLERIEFSFFLAMGITCIVFFIEGIMVKNLFSKTLLYLISSMPLYFLLRHIVRKRW